MKLAGERTTPGVVSVPHPASPIVASVRNAAVSVVNHPTAGLAYSKAALAGTILLRALVGLVLGIALAFLWDYLDSSVRDTR